MNMITPHAESEAANSLLALVRRASDACGISDANENGAYTNNSNKRPDNEKLKETTAPTVAKSNSESNHAPTPNASSDAKKDIDFDHVVGREDSSPPLASVPDRVMCSSPLATSSIDSNHSSSYTSLEESHRDAIGQENINRNSMISAISFSSNKADVPDVLMRLLLDPENHSTLSFLPHNRAFAVSNAKAFSKFLMRRKFKLTKFGCFVGKLQRWGFTHHSDASNPECHLFYHPHFIKDDWKSLLKIKYSPRSNKEDAAKLNCSIPGEGSSFSLRRGNLQFQAIQRAINRHIELTTMCDSLRRMPGVAPAQQDPGNNQGTRTKNIINAAIECLMHDEDLIARKRSGQFSHRGVLQRRRF